MEAGARDVVLVTLDSCRYDTAQLASTPSLDRLGPLLRAETSGTFTLPAHAAIFGGHLPVVQDGCHLLDGADYLSVWRPAAARSRVSVAAVVFDGMTLMHHYRSLGYDVLGAGGVTFFDPAEPGNWLPTLFDKFHYYGRPNRGSSPGSRVCDRTSALTLAHAESLAASCMASRRFFLFVNCPSTHVPYTTPSSPLTTESTRLLEHLYELHDSKRRHEPGEFSYAELRQLRLMQVSALEWADRQLGALFGALASREPLVVVCADHGEEFGEGGRYGHGHAHPTVTTVPMWTGILGRAFG